MDDAESGDGALMAGPGRTCTDEIFTGVNTGLQLVARSV